MINYAETITSITSRTLKLLRDLEPLHMDSNPFDRTSQLIKAALDGEYLAKDLRRLLIVTSIATKDEVYKSVCEINGYDVRVDGDVTVITMPPLPLKSRPLSNCAYLIAPLVYCLEKFTRENEVRMYDRCVVEIKHCFPPETPLRYLHDYDNLEVKKLLDAIALFFLVDDNIKKCRLYHIGEESDSFRTEVRIYPLEVGDKSARAQP